MSANTLFIILLIIISAGFLLSRILEALNLSRLGETVPQQLKDLYSPEEYQRSQRYLRDNTRLAGIQSVIGFVLILAVLLLGGFGWLDALLRSWTANPILQALYFFGILGATSGLLSLPFSVYSTFVIEEKYGFNRTGLRTFILDILKSTLLAIILGGGLLALIVWIYGISGNSFWLIVWGVITAFSLLMTLLYSDLIVPLFNKQEPLPEGGLREAILEYARTVDFSLRDIYVINASKRSGKSNAYFTGFGPRRRIVLYDTLIEEHSTDELVAVLAHEAGHYKKKHVLLGMMISIIQSGLMLFILSLFIRQDSALASTLASSVGAQASFHIGILVFGIIYSPLSTVTGLLMNALSRKNEYAADRFAADTYDGEALGMALKKLSVKNLSNLTPHPLYVTFNYSHPPLLQRLEALAVTSGTEK